MARVVMKKGREGPVLRRHPWIFSGAVAEVEGRPNKGDVVEVVDRGGNFLAHGHFSPSSQIRVRLLSWREDEPINRDFWRRRLRAAVSLRKRIFGGSLPSACRVVYSEADGLPGLVVDKYGDFLVLQALSAGSDQVKGVAAEILSELLSPRGVYERSDAEVRGQEALGGAKGPILGEDPPGEVEIEEGGRRFLVDVKRGQKTGFFLDQRENRLWVSTCVKDKSVLDVFAYTGGFSVHALAAGAASVTLVESSSQALALAKSNLEMNFPDKQGSWELVEGNAHRVLRQYRDEARKFDVVVIDPPKLARTKVGVEKALRAYKDINLLGLKLVEREGLLVTFSCSGVIGQEMFSEMLSWASIDAGREIKVVRRLGQSPDHPTTPTFPESTYLKGFACIVV